MSDRRRDASSTTATQCEKMTKLSQPRWPDTSGVARNLIWGIGEVIRVFGEV